MIRKRVCAVLAASYALLFAAGCGGGYGDKCETDDECGSEMECLRNCTGDQFGSCVCSEVSVCTRTCDSDEDCVEHDTGSLCTSCEGHSNCTK